MKQTKDITYREIAKMFCANLPVEGQDFTDKVNEYLDTIKAMPKEAKVALRSAYIFSRKVPREEREDMFQELCLAVLQVNTKEEKFGYTIARCDWRNWWQKFKTRQHYLAGSLNKLITDNDGQQVELAELIVGEAEFEAKLNGKMDAETVLARLPEAIKNLVTKRLIGKALSKLERECLNRWSGKNAHLILHLT